MKSLKVVIAISLITGMGVFTPYGTSASQNSGSPDTDWIRTSLHQPQPVIPAAQPEKAANPATPEEETALLKQMTRDFLQAMADEDYNKVVTLCPSLLFKDLAKILAILKEIYSGLQIMNIGEPQLSANTYPGRYIPYTIRLKNGDIKEWKLAIRSDNPIKYHHVDGGF